MPAHPPSSISNIGYYDNYRRRYDVFKTFKWEKTKVFVAGINASRAAPLSSFVSALLVIREE